MMDEVHRFNLNCKLILASDSLSHSAAESKNPFCVKGILNSLNMQKRNQPSLLR